MFLSPAEQQVLNEMHGGASFGLGSVPGSSDLIDDPARASAEMADKMYRELHEDGPPGPTPTRRQRFAGYAMTFTTFVVAGVVCWMVFSKIGLAAVAAALLILLVGGSGAQHLPMILAIRSQRPSGGPTRTHRAVDP